MTRGTCKEVRRGRSPPTAGRTVTGAHLLRTRGGGARSRRPPGSRRNPPRPRSPRRRPLQLPPTPSGPPRHQIRGRREGSGVGVEGGRREARGGGGAQAKRQASVHALLGQPVVFVPRPPAPPPFLTRALPRNCNRYHPRTQIPGRTKGVHTATPHAKRAAAVTSFIMPHQRTKHFGCRCWMLLPFLTTKICV